MHVLITGAASGIARKVIEKLKKENLYIYVTTHTDAQCELAKKRYEHDSNIKCLKLDITNKKDREKIKDLPIDILICSAAIGKGGSFLEIDMDVVRENFEVNVFSSFIIVQMVLKKLIHKKGRIIMISSLAGIIPMPFIGSYAATKASINKITEALRMEVRMINKNIDFIQIEPGFYKTGFNRVMFENKYDDKDTLFKKEIELIKAKENLILHYIAKKNIDKIADQIVKATLEKKPKKVYRAPTIEKWAAKVYLLFFG